MRKECKKNISFNNFKPILALRTSIMFQFARLPQLKGVQKGLLV